MIFSVKDPAWQQDHTKEATRAWLSENFGNEWYEWLPHGVELTEGPLVKLHCYTRDSLNRRTNEIVILVKPCHTPFPLDAWRYPTLPNG